VPVINENDTVATNEIRYGDNDRLAARVATMTSSDLLILLSDIDGLYTAPPTANPNAKLIPLVETVTADIEAMAGAAESELSRGGMRTKIEAAKIATSSGTHMLIASGKIEHPLQAIADGRPCTWFLTPLVNGVGERLQRRHVLAHLFEQRVALGTGGLGTHRLLPVTRGARDDEHDEELPGVCHGHLRRNREIA